MKTVAELVEAGRRDLALHSESALVDAQILLAHVLGRDRTWLYTWSDRPVTQADQQAYFELVARRSQGEPVAYLVHHQGFWRLDLKVSPATLIPRPDTELLVELALALGLPAGARVLDLGTGTGAIALALALERPLWTLIGVDSEEQAVALARENALRNNLARVQFLCSDWFSQVAGRFDLIVSNPPYIASEDPHLQQGDVRFEPPSALVSGADGLNDLRAIIGEAKNHLVPGGVLLVEHGYDQGAAVRALFTVAGFADIATHRDLAHNERVTGGKA